MEQIALGMILNLYREIISNPFLRGNCHLVSKITQQRYSQSGYNCQIIDGELYMLNTKTNEKFSFEKTNNGHAWNMLVVENVNWLVDNSAFHQRDIVFTPDQPILIENYNIAQQIQTAYEDYQLSYIP